MANMSVKQPLTIDNLGKDASIRYAKDKQLFEPRLIEEAKLVPQKAEIPVAKPYVPSEFDQLFTIERTALWASFSPPPESLSSMKPLFSYQLIPSLGGYEKQEADAEKLSGLGDALSKEEGGSQQEDADQEEKERQTLITLLQCIEKLEKSLNLINARRNQYQRG